MKKSAMEAYGESQPTSLMFGTVTSINPIKIQIDQKLILTEDFLLLTDNVRDYKVEMTVDHETEEEETDHTHNFTDVTPSGAIQSVTQPQNQKHKHKYKGKKVFTVHNALKNGEYVLLIQIQGGQKYVVLDRVEGRS